MKELQFDKKRKRVQQCPCGKSNADSKFVPLIGYEDKGYCHSCTQTFLPKLQTSGRIEFPIIGNQKISPSFLTTDLVKDSMEDYESNVFTNWLYEQFGEVTAKGLIQKYKIGTSDHWRSKSTTVFWYCDISGNCRSGKLMLYGSDGHRIKKPFDYCNWVHSVIKPDNFDFTQCFFGEHLLNMPESIQKPIIIVESEKSAIVSSAFFPNYLWIACGGANGLTLNKCSVLEGRNIILYPDLGKFDLWSEKATQLQSICASVKISSFLEENAIEEDRKSGYDIADYLVNFQVTNSELLFEAISCSLSESKSGMDEQSTSKIAREFTNTNLDNDFWNIPIFNKSFLAEIEEIEEFLRGKELPKGAVQINPWTITKNIAFSIERALYNAKLTAGKQHTGHECLKRLRDIKIALCTYLPDK